MNKVKLDLYIPQWQLDLQILTLVISSHCHGYLQSNSTLVHYPLYGFLGEKVFYQFCSHRSKNCWGHQIHKFDTICWSSQGGNGDVNKSSFGNMKLERKQKSCNCVSNVQVEFWVSRETFWLMLFKQIPNAITSTRRPEEPENGHRNVCITLLQPCLGSSVKGRLKTRPKTS